MELAEARWLGRTDAVFDLQIKIARTAPLRIDAGFEGTRTQLIRRHLWVSILSQIQFCPLKPTLAVDVYR